MPVLQLPKQDVDSDFRPLASRFSNWRVGKLSVPTASPILFNLEIPGQVLVVLKNIGNFDVWIKETNINVTTDGFLIRAGEKEDLLVTEAVTLYLQAVGGASEVCVRVHGYQVKEV